MSPLVTPFSPCCSNNSTASNHKHVILGFVIATFLAPSSLKFQSMNIAAPFETHSAILTMFVITTLVYAVAWAIETKLETSSNSYHHVILSNISLLLGSLATVLLVLILVPGLGYLILLIWAIYFVGVTYRAWRKLHQLYSTISSVSDFLNKLLGLHNEESIRCSTSSSSSSAKYTLAICIFLVTVFLTLMNLKFLPVNIPSPFETHCDIMTMFIITILVYASTSYCHEIISKYITLLSGSLAPVLLALILFPGYLGRLMFLVWTIYFVKLSYDAWRKLYQLFNTISSVSDFLNQLLGRRGLHNEETIPYITSSKISTATHQKHVILGLPIAVFLALLPLRFPSMNTTAAPFETHCAILSKFVITTLLYAVAWAMETKLETCAHSYHRVIISNISLLLGSLATILLTLILVPGLGYFTLLIWTLFLVKLIYDACQKLHQLYRAISFASHLFNELLGRGCSV
ncbi:Uncharacterized protein TCM_042514 [Theobroma cacao]|uniref:Transmembrane protein n=1 Tax=Theobroma cacao TaxID=3641 RepID=A0A061FKE9_THECC|nr:Uncharacterized protein TCM_042514 [Theobroma cacao]